jgi:tRNA pseudouridine38-40 synthase
MTLSGNHRRNYALLLQYDGSAYKGWQHNPQLPTVGGVLIAVFRRVGLGATPFGASRTDAGVHARAQVASFHSRGDLDLNHLQHHLNDQLPSTIRILAMRSTDKQFHAHWSSIGKIYRYRISFCGEARALRLPSEKLPLTSIDYKNLLMAMEKLQSASDLKAFSNERNSRPRQLLKATIHDFSSKGVTLEFQAKGFGKHQVRNLVSAALELACNNISENQWNELLAGLRSRPPRADPDGLALHRVLYAPNLDPFPDIDRLARDLFIP